MQGGDLTLALLLDYILNRFLLIFLITLLGSFTHDLYDTYKNLTPISIKRIFISGIFSSMILCAAYEYIKPGFALTILVCFCVGAWSFKLFEALMTWSIVESFLKHLLKKSKTIIGETISETIEELDKKDSKNKKQQEDDKSTGGN